MAVSSSGHVKAFLRLNHILLSYEDTLLTIMFIVFVFFLNLQPPWWRPLAFSAVLNLLNGRVVVSLPCYVNAYLYTHFT